MSELKLRRLLEHNQRLREDLARPRVRVSEASARYVLPPSLPLVSPALSLIRYCKTTKDHLVRLMSIILGSCSQKIGPLSVGPGWAGGGSLWTATN